MSSNETQQTRAVFPASFDPLTNGHIDVAHRALAIFDHLVIAVAYNGAGRSSSVYCKALIAASGSKVSSV